MPVIGLTGGIASGKSTAASHLESLGAQRIDADQLGHRVYEPGTPGFAKVVAEFGAELIGADGGIDRQVLGAKVFGHPEAMRRLTDIVWPEIRALAEARIAEIRSDQPNAVVVLEAAVLLEANWDDLVDEVWVVLVEEEMAIERLKERNGLSRDEALARIRSQLSNDERSARADVSIQNSGSLSDLYAQLRAEWKRLAG